MENPVVKVEHLYHRYSTQWAIEDINLEIELSVCWDLTERGNQQR